MAVGAAGPAVAQYNPVTAFFATSNPNGVRSYSLEDRPDWFPRLSFFTSPTPVPSSPGPFINFWRAGFVLSRFRWVQNDGRGACGIRDE